MYDLVVISMFKNESMILKEWLDHNISVGVQHFYLIDNGSTDNYLRILKPYMRKGYISLVIDPSRWKYGEESKEQSSPYFDSKQKRLVVAKDICDNTQTLLMNRHYLGLIKQTSKWILVIDQDEYVFSPMGKLTDILRSVPDSCTDIWIPWRIFGSGGHDTQPESIRKGFLHMRPFSIQSHGNRAKAKSITRVSSIINIDIHICHVHHRNTMTPDGRLNGNMVEWAVAACLKQFKYRYTDQSVLL